jgi:type IV secretory pathway VirB10-like protein
MADKTPQSPDSLELRGAPLASARLSRKAAMAAFAVFATILGVVVVNVSKDKPKGNAEETAAKKDLVPAGSAGRILTKDVPDIMPMPRPIPPAREQLPPQVSRAEPVKSSEDIARLADSEILKFTAAESTRMQPAGGGMSAENPAQAANPNTNTPAPHRGNGLPGGTDEVLANEPDLNRQGEKLEFLQKTRQSAYLNARLAAPLSPFELKTGTVIPAILVGEMNSDLPGEVIAQVSQNVYDTASGNHLLIPQGSKLFGTYDSQVSFGQERLLVSWQRIIFPNADTLELGGMSGHDQGGNAGFADQVNNHYAGILGWALVSSVLSAGYQLSQPQQGSLLVPPSNNQVVAGAVGQQVSEVGIEIARRKLRVQPTIVIRKGYRLNVLVNKDVVFPGSYQP